MEYLYKLVNEINRYDGSNEATARLRDLVCYISDQLNIKDNEYYKAAIFDAAHKLRTFGYVKGPYKINIDEIVNDGLYDIKYQSIENYYSSKVYKNNILDKRQKEIIDTFMTLDRKRLIVSAPTSFGKTFLLRELIYLNKERYNNILLIFPTVALLNENTLSIKSFIKNLELDYNIINNVYSKVDINSRNIYILTPERTLKLLSDNTSLNIDFFFFDEVYKIDEDFSKDEDSSIDSMNPEGFHDKGNRAKAFRITLYILSKMVKEYYIAGPYLNLENVKSGFNKYIISNGISIKQIDFEPTIRIEIDAWNKNTIEHHPLLGPNKVELYKKGTLSTKNKISGIVSYLNENKLGQAIFYCSNPSYTLKYAQEAISALEKNPKVIQNHSNFIEHLKKRYGIRCNFQGKSINSSDYWSFINILSFGYGVHHGRFPKYIQKEILNMFNDGDIDYLFCTSTIIEGVNTNAKNVVIINNSIGNKKLTPFALKNIKGRAGRYYHHFVGRVFYINEEQREIEKQEDMMLNFPTYDDISLLEVDIDNSEITDLSNNNALKKTVREKQFNKNKLPDSVFIKNRLFQRDIQEKYLEYLFEYSNFEKFKGLINNSNNIQYFLNNKLMNKILDSFADIKMLTENIKNVYHAVVSSYSIKRFAGLMEFQLSNIRTNPEAEIDGIYSKVFEQIKNIIEYEVPKLLCFFEAIYQQVGRLKGYNMDEFNLSAVIRFFELGVTTAFGIYLVEFGYPIDAIRLIEEKFSSLSNIDLEESIFYVKNNIDRIKHYLDSYETGLLMKAIDL